MLRGSQLGFLTELLPVTVVRCSLYNNLGGQESQQNIFSSPCLKFLFIPLPAEQKPTPPQGRIQCLQHFPEPRARVRLPEEFGDRREDQ